MYGYGYLNSFKPVLGGVSFDADAQAFITAASITDPTQQGAVNQLVLDLKAASIWTKMKAVYPFVGGSASTHKWNLKDPRDLDAAFRLVFAGGWTHSSTGALPNGTTAYADSKLNPNAELQLNSTALHYYSRTNGYSTTLMGSNENGGNATVLIPKYASGLNADYSCVNNGTGGVSNAPASSTLGLLSVNRVVSTEYKGYRNGASYFTAVRSSVAKPAFNIYIGARNNFGLGVWQYSNCECAFSAIGDGLTSQNMADLYTAVQTFQTTLGRQV